MAWPKGKKREMSEEHKAKLRENIAKARAARAAKFAAGELVVSEETKEKLRANIAKAREARLAKVAARRAAESENETVVVSDRPKRVLSDEQKAKMKAGREAAKAKKLAASEVVTE